MFYDQKSQPQIMIILFCFLMLAAQHKLWKALCIQGTVTIKNIFLNLKRHKPSTHKLVIFT